MTTEAQKTKPPKTVTIIVNNSPVSLPHRETTGAEIKQAAGLPATYKLYGPHGDEIQDTQQIKVHEHERFTAISGQDVS